MSTIKKAKVLHFFFDELSYIDECNEENVMLHKYIWPTLENEVGYLIDIKKRFKSFNSLMEVFYNNKKIDMINKIRDNFYRLLFKDYYSRLDILKKTIKKNSEDLNKYEYTMYADISQHNIVRPITSIENFCTFDYINFIDIVFCDSLYLLWLVCPYKYEEYLNEFGVIPKMSLIQSLLFHYIPFMEIKNDKGRFFCFNDCYVEKITKYTPFLNFTNTISNDSIESNHQFLEYSKKLDLTKDFSNIVTEYNYDYNTNIQPIVNVKNGEVELL